MCPAEVLETLSDTTFQKHRYWSPSSFVPALKKARQLSLLTSTCDHHATKYKSHGTFGSRLQKNRTISNGAA